MRLTKFGDLADVDKRFNTKLQRLTGPLIAITPTKRPSKRSWSWWNPDISAIRTIFHSVSRAYRNGMATKFEDRATRSAYFKAIKAAKSTHWNEFVKNANSKD